MNVLVTAILGYLVNHLSFICVDQDFYDSKLDALRNRNCKYSWMDVILYTFYSAISPFCNFVVALASMPLLFVQCLSLLFDTLELFIKLFYSYVIFINEINIF